MVSFDDDQKPGWPAVDVPVTVPSPAGMIYGATFAQDEVVALDVDLTAVGPPYPLMNITPIANEFNVHQSLAPSPDPLSANPEEDDDDVDSLDIVEDVEYGNICPYWYFSPDHEAYKGLDPGGIYLSMGGMFAPVQVIDEVFHLGLPDESTDIDAFEFTWLSEDYGMAPVLALLFSVDDDDPLTLFDDESGGLLPNVIYVSWMTGWFTEFLNDDRIHDDIDALTIWNEPIAPECACPGDIAQDNSALGPDGHVSLGDVYAALAGCFAPGNDGPPYYRQIPTPPGYECADVAQDNSALGPDGHLSLGDVYAMLAACFAPGNDGPPYYRVPCMVLP